MTKKLKITNNKCNGCELCLFELQRQLERIGLEGSLVRVFKNLNTNTGELEIHVEIDPRINSLNISAIADICPKKVFEIVEDKNNNNEGFIN